MEILLLLLLIILYHRPTISLWVGYPQAYDRPIGKLPMGLSQAYG